MTHETDIATSLAFCGGFQSSVSATHVAIQNAHPARRACQVLPTPHMPTDLTCSQGRFCVSFDSQPHKVERLGINPILKWKGPGSRPRAASIGGLWPWGWRASSKCPPLLATFVGEPGLMQVFLQGTYSKPLRSGLTVVSVQGGKEIKPP